LELPRQGGLPHLPKSLQSKEEQRSRPLSLPMMRQLCDIGDNLSIAFPGEFPMSEPVIARKSPFAVEVEAGKSYFWCACGRSANQPFCDGSHKGSEFTPVKFEATESKTVYFCGCKHSANPVFCDGSHSRL
jgi:CDGSH-type Zn-finger protein